MGRVCHTHANTQSQFVWIDQSHREWMLPLTFLFAFFLWSLTLRWDSFLCTAVLWCAYAYHYYLNSSYSQRFSCLASIVIALIVLIWLARVCALSHSLIIFISSFVISYFFFFFKWICCVAVILFCCVALIRLLHILSFCVC